MGTITAIQTSCVRLFPAIANTKALLLLGILLLIFGYFQRNRLFAAFSFALRRIQAWAYLFRGVEIIQEKFNLANGGPFEVIAPDNRYVFVSSPDHLKELDSASDSVLSLNSATKQMLQPCYTMHGFNWFDERGTEGVGFIRVLRTLLTNKLPEILPNLSTITRNRFSRVMDEHPTENKTVQLAVYPAVLKLVVLANAFSFFGEDLAKNEAFLVSALEHVEQTLVCAEIVKLVPKFLVPVVGRIIARRLQAHASIFDVLFPIAEQRCLERDQKALGQPVPHHADCIQWIMETSPKKNPWSAKRIVHELIAIWFGSVHAMSTTITFALHDFCLHPEYALPLRQELSEHYFQFERTGLGLPLLDSFIKESARLTPIESQSTRRGALQPFAFSDGTMLRIGDWACTPVRAVMQKAEYYPEPTTFHGFRFADPATVQKAANSLYFSSQKPAQLTDVGDTWHVWGTGRMTCPGRFYATSVMKVVISQVIMQYDCKLVDESSPRFFTWRSTTIPTNGTMMAFKPL